MKKIINHHFVEHQTVLSSFDILIPHIEKAASLIIDALKNRKKIFWCGNGGSASDAQHLAGELIGRFRKSCAIKFSCIVYWWCRR